MLYMNISQLINILAQFLAFIIYLGLIVFVLQKNPRALLNRLCALALAPFALWSLGTIFFHSAASADTAMLGLNVASLGWCSFPVTAFWFYLAFTRHEKLLRNRMFVAICVLLAICFIYLQWAGYLINDLIRRPYGWSTVWAKSALSPVFFAYYILFIGACIYLAFDYERKTNSVREKKQAKILHITIAISLALGSLTDVIFPLLGIGLLPNGACVVIVVWAGGLVYAITKYGLMTLTPAAAATDILATMGDALILLGLNGKIISTNKETLDLLGYTAEELVNKEFSFIIGGKAAEGDDFLQETLKQGKIRSRDATYLTKNGDGVPVLLSASAVKDKEGEPVGVVVTALNITERKRAEEKLKSSEQRFKDLAENISDWIWEVDEEGGYIYASPKVKDILGYEPEEVMGKTPFDLMLEGEAEKIRDAFGKIVSEKIPFSGIENWNLHKNGKKVLLETSGIPLFDANGEIKGYRGIDRDITERKQAERLLWESEQKYKNLVENMNEGLSVIDEQNIITFVNSKFCQMLGYRLDEVVGKHVYNFFDSKNLEILKQELANRPKGISSQFEMSWTAKSGRQVPTFMSGAPFFDAEGIYRGAYATVLNFTERKKMELDLRQSEERYRTLVDLALVGIAIHQNERYVFANKELANMLGYTQEEIIDLPIAETIHPDERDRVVARAQRREAGGNEPITYEVQLLKKDGSTVYALISNAVMDYKDQPAVLMSVVNITDTKVRKELEQANKELAAFSYSVSHDLRAPLRSIDGFSQALLEDYEDNLDAQGKDYLYRVRAATQRMGQLIDDLLALSRVTRAEMRYTQVDLSAMAKTIAGQIKEMDPERAVEFFIAEEVTAQGDASLLRVVLENLLNNAWKFTAKHTHAKIEFGVIQQDGQSVYFVRDDGAGFDMTYVDKLFKPFQRLHESTEFEGTGIGLATVQRIIHRHGGRVWTEGSVERGAIFYFTL